MSIEKIQEQFDTYWKKQQDSIVDRAKDADSSVKSIAEAFDKVKRDELSQYKYCIKTILLPGGEEEWEKIYNDPTVLIIKEEHIQTKDGNMSIIVEYRQAKSSKNIVKVTKIKKGCKK